MSDWKYKVGQEINNSIIVDRFIKTNKDNKKTKWYKLKCLKCDSVHEKMQCKIETRGCPFCNHRKTNITNCISTTDPNLIKYFVEIKDVDIYSRDSTHVSTLKCPYCGYVKNMKITNFTRNGFHCPFCNKINSMGEKIFLKLLIENNISFEKEYSPIWANNKRYDFYLKDYNAIIEIHGYQHYKDTSWGTYDEQRQNDLYKYDIAVLNGFEYNKNYFIINYKNEKLFIKDINSLQLFNNIDVNIDMLNFELNPMIKYVCDEYNKNHELLKDLSNRINISEPTLRRYLTIGNKIGYCNYDYKEHLARTSKNRDYKENKKRIAAYRNNIFICEQDSIAEMADNSFNLFGVYMRRDSISRAIRNGKEYKGIKFIFTERND